jgi:hypothetical protein
VDIEVLAITECLKYCCTIDQAPRIALLDAASAAGFYHPEDSIQDHQQEEGRNRTQNQELSGVHAIRVKTGNETEQDAKPYDACDY